MKKETRVKIKRETKITYDSGLTIDVEKGRFYIHSQFVKFKEREEWLQDLRAAMELLDDYLQREEILKYLSDSDRDIFPNLQ